MKSFFKKRIKNNQGFTRSLEDGIALLVLPLTFTKTLLRKLKATLSNPILKQRKTMPSFSAGFTLVELLVTIVIFVLLTGIVLFNQNSFNNGVILKNLAYDIALNIKQIQTYGISVRESQIESVFSSYGVYFDNSADNRSFILFADTDSNGSYNNSQSFPSCPISDQECIQKYSISRGSYISNICTGIDSSCSLQSQVSKLTILFKRPNPNALIYVNDNMVDAISSARIIISSATNATTSVIVTGAGQIYVQ